VTGVAKKILVVDDDVHIRHLLREELSEVGYRVETASNGKEALERLTGSDRPDLVILDLRMQGMNGLDTIGFLLKLRLGMPMIIYSSYGNHMNDSLAMAADAFVVKSSDLSELKNKVHDLAGHPQDRGCIGPG
jgi:DNA-binding NtrC family response regulator